MVSPWPIWFDDLDSLPLRIALAPCQQIVWGCFTRWYPSVRVRLVLSREWMGMGNGMIITSDYGSFPHSLRLAPARFSPLKCNFFLCWLTLAPSFFSPFFWSEGLGPLLAQSSKVNPWRMLRRVHPEAWRKWKREDGHRKRWERQMISAKNFSLFDGK